MDIGFIYRLNKELDSTTCGDILDATFGKRYDLADPTQVAEWQAAGALDKCTAVVRTAVRIAAQIITEEK